MSKKKNKPMGLFVGGEMVKNGRIVLEQGVGCGRFQRIELTRMQALKVLAEDTPENYPPEEGW